MKKCLNFITCFLLVVSLMAGFTVESKADYESPRVVQGAPVAGLTPKNEGGAYLAGSTGFMSNLFSNSDKITYTWEYGISQGHTEGALAFDHTRFYLTGSNFGRAADSTMLYLDQKGSWPENLQNGIEYTLTGNKVILSYKLTKDDIDWMNANYVDGTQLTPLALRAIVACKKLDGNVEAQYCITNYKFTVIRNGNELTEYTKTASYNAGTDKRTVEIAEKVAPVASDGTIGTYNSNPSKITYLDDNQEAIVKLTLTRPVGIANSGNNEVNIKVPEGMTYVVGSMSATSSSGLTVNLTDSAAAPKFSFTGLPVGENVVVTYKLKAGAGDIPVKYNTGNTLTNIQQQGLKASANNDYVTGSVYSANEYNTTTSMPLQLNGKYKITFDSKGGNYTPNNQSIKGGDLSTKPTSPTKEDNKYGKVVFDNWYYLDGKGKEKTFDFSTPIRSDYDLYAKYKAPNIKVKIKTDDKHFKPGQEVKYDVIVSNVGTSVSDSGEVTFNIPKGMKVKDLDGGTLSDDGKSIVYQFNPIKDGSNTKFHPVLVVTDTAIIASDETITPGAAVNTGDNNMTGFIALGLLSSVVLLLLCIRRRKELE